MKLPRTLPRQLHLLEIEVVPHPDPRAWSRLPSWVGYAQTGTFTKRYASGAMARRECLRLENNPRVKSARVRTFDVIYREVTA